jgi:hypothetical protein
MHDVVSRWSGNNSNDNNSLIAAKAFQAPFFDAVGFDSHGKGGPV